MTERARLTLDIELRLHNKLKVLAARRGKTMRDICVQAIEREVEEEPTDFLTADEAPLLAELWDNERDAIYDNA
jgi:hypothetical protein